MTINVSVIIPVYNAETYLPRCIESLLSQSLQDCEFIFVNDGSSDRSRHIIENYQKNDERIVLINKENEGVSIARNTGIQIAKGDYIGFVDADDYIEGDMYKRLYHTAVTHHCDVVISNFESDMEGHKVIINYPFPQGQCLSKAFITQEILPYFIKENHLNSVCNKIYNHQLVKEFDIEFPDKQALGEDGLFNICFFSQAKTMFYLNYSGYHYCETPGSATRNIAIKNYFKRALEVYTSEVPAVLAGTLSPSKIERLKTIKFIKSVMAYIHIYFAPSKEVYFKKRYKYVKQMITNDYVQEALSSFYETSYSRLGRYEKYIIDMIKRKSTLGLYCATAYSRFRNK